MFQNIQKMNDIPSPSKKRLIQLSQLLNQLTSKKITSPELQKLTGWGEATIRRDISHLKLHNGASNGYDVALLKQAIEQKLELAVKGQNEYKCCIVGLGNLGGAFLETSLFGSESFKLAAGFDTNQNKIDMLRSKIPLYPTTDLEKVIRQQQIEYAILTVSDEKAQIMAERLSKYGIKGILNYTNTVLTLPPEIKVLNASPTLLLQNLYQGVSLL